MYRSSVMDINEAGIILLVRLGYVHDMVSNTARKRELNLL